MSKSFATIRVTDGGKYDRTFAQLMLEKKNGEEQMFIKYGKDDHFYPCSAIYTGGLMHLSKAMVGKKDDIIISVKEWMRVLTLTGSIELLADWKEKTKQKTLKAA